MSTQCVLRQREGREGVGACAEYFYFLRFCHLLLSVLFLPPSYSISYHNFFLGVMLFIPISVSIDITFNDFCG